MGTKWVVRGSGLALAGLIMAAAAGAAETPVEAQATTVTVNGVQVAISPRTGQLVAPTAEQRAALSRAMLQQSADTTPQLGVHGGPSQPRNEAEARATFRKVQLRNGRTAVGMALPENLMSSLVAERHADGSLSIHHAGDAPAKPAPVEVTK